MIRILNIDEGGGYGGPQRRIISVAKHLMSDHNIHTTVLASSYDFEQFRNNLDAAGLDYATMPFHKLSNRPIRILLFILFFIPETYRLFRFIAKGDYDVIHCNGSWQFKGIIASYFTKSRGVWHLNDTFMPRMVYLLFVLVAKLFSPHFIVSSERTKEFYLRNKKLRDRVLLKIYPPVNTSLFLPKLEVTRDSKDDKLVIVAIGNYNPLKGYHFLLKAAKIVLDKTDRNVVFQCYGNYTHPQYKESLFRILNDYQMTTHVELNGPVSNVPKILKAADIFVCSSLYESGPMSVFEAMSAELPVVSTDVGDIRELFSIRESGIVIPTQDPQSLAQSILTLISDERARKEMGVKARITAAEYLDIGTCVSHHAKVYKGLYEV